MLGEIIPVRAKVIALDGFSAHADQGEIMRWLGTFPKAPKTTYIVHGEAAGGECLGRRDSPTAQVECRDRQVPAEGRARLVNSCAETPWRDGAQFGA
jgi:Cft2 family RNA processing exonuclease